MASRNDRWVTSGLALFCETKDTRVYYRTKILQYLLWPTKKILVQQLAAPPNGECGLKKFHTQPLRRRAGLSMTRAPMGQPIRQVMVVCAKLRRQHNKDETSILRMMRLAITPE
ncbi:hypothetical protein PoB_000104600 [Plakobranchus ocellatus]|uniref:Uncharacterized protein n=1 Tax=Plakobranchus ocellatus TaxID=259542 RepID=A0AAV3WX46_9GAST|nr:hypothetical protein PoB_000104600 [Plakobranchus ocellatus]